MQLLQPLLCILLLGHALLFALLLANVSLLTGFQIQFDCAAGGSLTLAMTSRKNGWPKSMMPTSCIGVTRS